jgi:hypothetical protein
MQPVAGTECPGGSYRSGILRTSVQINKLNLGDFGNLPCMGVYADGVTQAASVATNRFECSMNPLCNGAVTGQVVQARNPWAAL